MISYETLPLNQILPGDCLDILASLPEKSVDLVFADPPYNLQLRNELYRPDMSKVEAVQDDWDKFASFAAYDAFTRAWLQACRRVLKDSGTLWVIGSYHNIYRVGAILQDLDFWILNDVIWLKTNPMPNFRGVRFTNAHETLLWAQKKRGAKYTFNHQAMKALHDDLQMRSDWALPICGGKERLKINGQKAHSTQKPEALLYRVLLASSQPGDVLLDPFFGSGTSGAVAKKLGRRWLGIERDPLYVQVAQARLDAISADPAAEALFFESQKKKTAARLPFGALLENGFLQVGQSLYFDRKMEIAATVLANSHLRYQNSEGSIHKISSAIQGAPCNGWDHWYFSDESGKLAVIDTLRQKIRTQWHETQPTETP